MTDTQDTSPIAAVAEAILLLTYGELMEICVQLRDMNSDGQQNHLPNPRAEDWHSSRDESEPRCSADQWRTRDREDVLFISEMSDRHLGHCIRFASTKPQHRSRLSGLLEERSRRALKSNRDTHHETR